MAGDIALEPGEYSIDLVADESASGSTNLIGILPTGGFVLLDALVTDELAAEGVARDLIRQVQQARKDADLDVSDRISLTVSAPSEVLAAAEAHRELLCSETLTLQLQLTEDNNLKSETVVGDDLPVSIAVAKL